MPVSRPDTKTLQAAVDALALYGSKAAACAALKVSRSTFYNWLQFAAAAGLTANQSAETHKDAKIRRLEAELKAAKKELLDHDAIREGIIGLKNDIAQAEPPRWLIAPSKADSPPGVPLLFLSDLHCGEVVHPSQINGVNKYNLDIFDARMGALAERAIRLLSIISPKMDFPGIVMALGGDMVSGNIHDELTATNEINTMPTVLHLFGKLASLIGAMAETFGRVFVPCVTGNHGRDTRKIWSKDRHHTSFDWLLYQFLAKHFETDKRVTFHIPDGPDAYFKIYNQRYLLSHGDQFRGGDGMIGPLGPIIRGDHRKRSRNGQIDMGYDTLMIGHWHQYMHLTRLIVNGSLKGYDEYAFNANFPFEPPQQALWLTHPKYGITYRAPVFVDRKREPAKTSWVSVAA